MAGFGEMFDDKVIAWLQCSSIGNHFSLLDLALISVLLKYLLVITSISVSFSLIRKFVSVERRSLALVIFGAVLINILALMITPKREIGVLERILLLILLNSLFVFIAFVPALLKKYNLQDLDVGSRDLLNKDGNSGADMKCPSCGKLTISRLAAAGRCQTCGECMSKFKIKVPFFLLIFEPTLILGSLILSYYLWSRDLVWRGWLIALPVACLLICAVLHRLLDKLVKDK